MKNLRWRTLLVGATILFSVYLLIPTILKFGYGKQVSKNVKPDDPWYFSVLPSEVLKLGLDLRGGIHIVLGIDYNEVVKDAAVKMRNEIESLFKRENVAGITVESAPNNQIVVKYEEDAQWEKADALIGQWFSQRIDFVSQTEKSATLQMSESHNNTIQSRAREQALEIIRNRIDQFGLAEPILQPHGDDKILVQFPGVGQSEVGRIKDIIARTAKLSFQIVRSGTEEPQGVDKAPTHSQLQGYVENFIKENKLELSETKPISGYLDELNKYALDKNLIPSGTEIVFQKKANVNTQEAEYIPYLLNTTHIVDGDELEDAFYSFNQENNEPIVNFNLNATGATKFANATGENTGRYMAIVLDRNVHSAPRIRQRIAGGRAIIEMGQQPGKSLDDITSEAKDTALVLRSGALPARLEFLEERTIGPSLGADAIRAGTYSLGVGMVLVLIFMTIYYRKAGILAVIALVLNGIFVLGAMAAFEGTLTLPGLAGLTLTLGMAVDANVLIFEHIREELRAGKTVNMSIAEGYRRAFSAIFDSNITTILAALVLMSFGYGPIKGFAVTLLIGLVASMYTAVFVTRLIIDYFVVSKGKTSISI